MCNSEPSFCILVLKRFVRPFSRCETYSTKTNKQTIKQTKNNKQTVGKSWHLMKKNKKHEPTQKINTIWSQVLRTWCRPCSTCVNHVCTYSVKSFRTYLIDKLRLYINLKTEFAALNKIASSCTAHDINVTKNKKRWGLIY